MLPVKKVLSTICRDTKRGSMSLQVLGNLPSVERMAAAKDLQKFLNKYHRHAYRLVSCMMLCCSGTPYSVAFQKARRCVQEKLHSRLTEIGFFIVVQRLFSAVVPSLACLHGKVQDMERSHALSVLVALVAQAKPCVGSCSVS